MRLRHLWLAAVLALGACASTPTVYQPASGPGAVGYAETPIENDRWRVRFHGGDGANVQRVGDLALQRAAELTLAKGYDWFRVTEREVEGGGGGARPTVSLGMGSANFGGGTAFGAGGGLGFEFGGGAGASVTLEVLMGHGPAPREPDAYDAREVRKSFGAAA
ncbi:MAG: hypothetical protein P4L73_04250 [Caulobacteraceae bacterium]|nr:hypothetical protein [Caulobacteraceae bacterium]